MLGGASEQAILLLIENYGNAIGNPNSRQTFEANVQKASSIFRKYDIFEKHFSAHKGLMPQSLTENVDTLLRGIFDLIRNSRNDAGHPASGTPTSRDIVYSHLRLFTPYYKRISELIAWLTINKL